MSQRRTLILIAAVVIGALASFLVWNYVGGIQDQAYDDAERVKVFLVSEQISRGTPGNVAAQAQIVEETIPRKFKPANAIESLDDIAGQVARSDLVANQVVVADMFVEATDPEAQVSFADQIEQIQGEDQTTWTVSLDETRGAAGLIVPGDYVNILVTSYDEVASGATATDEEGEATDSSGAARYLFQKVRVLAVGTSTVSSAAAGPDGATPAVVGSGLMTLIVPADATQLLASIPPGNIYFSLVSRDYEPQPQGPVSIDPLPAETSDELTPYGPDGAIKGD